jgi:hypothetical protein
MRSQLCYVRAVTYDLVSFHANANDPRLRCIPICCKLKTMFTLIDSIPQLKLVYLNKTQD